MAEVKEFYVTFGQKYFQQEHPVLGSQLTPGHYVTVFAPSESKARALVIKELDLAWSNMYSVITKGDAVERDLTYEKGEIAVITEETIYIPIRGDGL